MLSNWRLASEPCPRYANWGPPGETQLTQVSVFGPLRTETTTRCLPEALAVDPALLEVVTIADGEPFVCIYLISGYILAKSGFCAGWLFRTVNPGPRRIPSALAGLFGRGLEGLFRAEVCGVPINEGVEACVLGEAGFDPGGLRGTMPLL